MNTEIDRKNTSIVSRQHIEKLIDSDVVSNEKALSFLMESGKVFSCLSSNPPYSNGSNITGFYPETLRKTYPAHDETFENFLLAVEAKKRSLTKDELIMWCDGNTLERITSIEEWNEYLNLLIELLNKTNKIKNKYPGIPLSNEQKTLISGFSRNVKEYRVFNNRTARKLDQYEIDQTIFKTLPINEEKQEPLTIEDKLLSEYFYDWLAVKDFLFKDNVLKKDNNINKYIQTAKSTQNDLFSFLYEVSNKDKSKMTDTKKTLTECIKNISGKDMPGIRNSFKKTDKTSIVKGMLKRFNNKN
jgi:hypothetical protein